MSSLSSLARGAQVDVRVEEGREQRPGPRPRPPRRPSASPAPGSASSAISPSRTTTSWAPSMPARGSSTRAPRSTRSPAGSAPAPRQSSSEIGRSVITRAPRSASARAARRRRVAGAARLAAAGEQLVEDRHPHDQAALDLLGDQRGGAVDHLGRELDPAVDRARVHQQLARAEPARVDLVVRPRTRGSRARRSRSSARAASAARRRRRPRRGRRGRRRPRSRAPSIPRGIRVGGPQTVTSAPIMRKASRQERATRLWRTSPTIQIRLPLQASRAGDAACRRRAAPGSGARACRRRR